MSKSKPDNQPTDKKIDLGINKLLNQVKVDYQLDFNKSEVKKSDNAKLSVFSDQDSPAEQKVNSEVIEKTIASEAKQPAVVFTAETGEYELDNLFNQEKWAELSDKSQKLLEENHDNLLIKSFWIYANLKLGAINPEILTINLDKKYSGLSVEDPNLEFYKYVAEEAVLNLNDPESKVANNLNQIFQTSTTETVQPASVSSLRKEAHRDTGEFVFSKAERPDGSFPDKKLAKKLANHSIADEDFLDEDDPPEPRRSIMSVLLILLALIIVLGAGYYMGSIAASSLETTEVKEPLSSINNPVSEPVQASRIEADEPPAETLEVTETSESFENDPSPLNDLLEELDTKTEELSPEVNPEVNPEGSSEVNDSSIPGSNLDSVNTKTPVEPDTVRQIIGEQSVNTQRQYSGTKSVQNPKQQAEGNLVSQGQGYLKGDVVIIKVRSSLYHKPDSYSAELMELLPRDRLQIISTEGDWLRVNAFDRVNGYIHISQIN